MAKRKKNRVSWSPFVLADMTEINATLGAMGLSLEDAVYLNSLYQVNVRHLPAPGGWPCAMTHLSIKRCDKSPMHDWRDIQRIKNELVGPENEAVEVYPAESRLVDSANQYHLWVFDDPEVRLPFGFNERLVLDYSGSNGSKQRPFTNDNRPDKLDNPDDIIKRIADAKRG